MPAQNAPRLRLCPPTAAECLRWVLHNAGVGAGHRIVATPGQGMSLPLRPPGGIPRCGGTPLLRRSRRHTSRIRGARQGAFTSVIAMSAKYRAVGSIKEALQAMTSPPVGRDYAAIRGHRRADRAQRPGRIADLTRWSQYSIARNNDLDYAAEAPEVGFVECQQAGLAMGQHGGHNVCVMNLPTAKRKLTAE
jgi:hypothetical protein